MPHKDPETRKAYREKWLKANLEKRRASGRKWARKKRARNPAPYLLSASKAQARIGGFAPPDITVEELTVLLADENRCCAIPSCGSKEKLHLDHDHQTGRIRGWLCNNHNWALGLCKDSPQVLREMAEYLERCVETVNPGA